MAASRDCEAMSAHEQAFGLSMSALEASLGRRTRKSTATTEENYVEDMLRIGSEPGNVSRMFE